MDTKKQFPVYSHTQTISWWILIPSGMAILISGYFGFSEGFVISAVVSVMLLILLLLFYSMTVTVDTRELCLAFGPGLFARKFLLSQMANCRVVRNKPGQGWGIRPVKNGLLYNVSGLDSVELVMANGHRYRIGTGEPHRLSGIVYQLLQEKRKPFAV